jgi:hypothetical protein
MASELIRPQRPGSDQTLDRTALLAYGLLTVAAWMLLHLYWGIAHDGVIYTMEALGHLRPDLYADDIFQRYGSQDRFTVFGQVYGWFIREFGLAASGSVLTACSHALFFASAWILVRSLLPTRMALLSLAIMVSLELPYGSARVFHLVEDFVSPRMASEALVLLAIWAAINARDVLSVALLILAAAWHPLIAAAGVAWLLWIRVTMPYPKVAAVAIMAAVALMIVAVHTPLAPLIRMDDAWYAIARQAQYLLITNWGQVDLTTAALPLTTLVAAIVFPWSEATRRLASAALAIGIAGVALAAVGGDWLHLTIILQGQPWRWMWLSNAMAILLIPAVIARLWQADRLGRATLAALLAAYAFPDVVFGAEICLLVLGMVWLTRSKVVRTDARQQTLILAGTIILALFGLVWDAVNRPIVQKIPFMVFHGLPVATLLRSYAHGSLFPALLIGLGWLLIFQSRRALIVRLWLVGAVIACASLVPAVAARWTTDDFSKPIYDAFAPWRDRIAPGAAILANANPLFSWVLLERPSYVSQPQGVSVLFSRAAALEMRRRAVSVAPFLANAGSRFLIGDIAIPDAPVTLESICAHTDVRYIVTSNDLAAIAIAVLPRKMPPPYRGLKLYACDASE